MVNGSLPDNSIADHQGQAHTQRAESARPPSNPSAHDEPASALLGVDELQALTTDGAPSAGAPDVAKHHGQRLAALTVGAIGVVFGDIGTSPLYSLQTVFTMNGGAVNARPSTVFGVISLVFWSILIVVTLKYVVLVMRADNDGEGGILALAALLLRSIKGRRRIGLVTLLGVIGAALFYGDSLITPAISVMSAVEGLELVQPGLSTLVVPVSAVILTALFAIQRFGTAMVGRSFGPIMILWFLTVAALGLPQVIKHPGVLRGLSPSYAVAFWVDQPAMAFIAMGAVVLCITGAEALYADMGHFGPVPIRTAWLALIFPCLTLNYLGQAALILHRPEAVRNPFFELAPKGFLVPLVILATVATVIASQSVISGAFSVTHQALHLGLLPRLEVRHTSKEHGGQIYVPAVNTMLFLGVMALVIGLENSAALAHAYGLAVTGTLVLTTILFVGVARQQWGWPTWTVTLLLILIGGFEAIYFSANVAKIAHGGWVPILIAVVIVTVMTTWLWGAQLVAAKRAELEGPIEPWLARVRDRHVSRVKGQAIYLHNNAETVPLALKETLRFHEVLAERVAIVIVQVLNIPHVRHVERVQITDLGTPDDGFVQIVIRLGFNDSQDVPHNLKWSYETPEFEFTPEQIRYFLSMLTLIPPTGRGLVALRKRLFVTIGNLSTSRMVSFHLPPNRTAIMGGQLYL